MNRHSAAIGVTRITVLGIALTFASLPALSGNLTFPQTRAATYEETRQYQALA